MSSGKTAVANRNAPPQSGKAIVNAQNQVKFIDIANLVMALFYFFDVYD